MANEPACAALLVVDGPDAADADASGVGLAGRAGLLLEELLEGVSLARSDLLVTAFLTCAPSNDRDPSSAELATSFERLGARVALLRPVVVVALGGLVTKLLRGDPAPIRECRGREEPATLGEHAFWLLPAFHPAAALYAPALVEQLRADLGRLPELVARGWPQVAAARAEREAGEGPVAVARVQRAAGGGPGVAAARGRREAGGGPVVATGRPEPEAAGPGPDPGQLELF